LTLTGTSGAENIELKNQKDSNCKSFQISNLGTKKAPLSLIDNGARYQWAELDSNQRRLSPMGLQPIPFSHSGIDPDERANFTQNVVKFNSKM
jgi:hypothetical protein